ncbi:MAG: molybdopterin-synthase adenylyltransferase MoeB [Rhizobiales bacterium]|nr:molybdopterin-synthase adenylyltransferase MoeB [Hyphomicrobiales bacterium]
MALTDEELERYARHIILHEVGGPGQQKLKAAKVLVIGAGGLGSPVVLYLAAAGVGTIGIVDDDVVSLSNLQRQVAHLTPNVGMSKTQSAHQTISGINPNVEVVEHTVRLSEENAAEIISGYDIVADGCDNFVTRFLVSDACFHAKIPLVSAAIGQFDGQISTFKPYETAKDGTPFPTYRCLHGEAPAPGTVPTCAEAGVLGVTAGVVGTLQATEVIKEIIGIGESLAGRLVMYDGLATSFYELKLTWNPGNPLNGTG